MKRKPIIGFIGQGFIGKNYADNFEKRGFTVVRYALEEPYARNKEAIKDCDLVFIAVPTPTTPRGFDTSILKKALPLVGKGKIAVLKSTIVPGTTKRLQDANPHVTVLYSPEFLSEKTAAYDVAHPFVNVVGMTQDSPAQRKAAALLHAIFPQAPARLTCSSTEAELIKYAHNISGYTQIVTFNFLYDIARKVGASWEVIEAAVKADPYISNRYAKPVHKSGRGAGGHCFIKDFAALRGLYEVIYKSDKAGIQAMRSWEKKNIDLLVSSKKDLDLLKGVYGNSVMKRKKA
jgi:nucleotide sugar dehydrogenase